MNIEEVRKEVKDLKQKYIEFYKLYEEKKELLDSLENTDTAKWIGKYICIENKQIDGIVSVLAGLVDYVEATGDGNFIFSKSKIGFYYYEIDGKLFHFEMRNPFLSLEDIRKGYEKPIIISKEEYYKKYNEVLERLTSQIKSEENDS